MKERCKKEGKKGGGMNSKIKTCTKFQISNIWFIIKYMRPEKYHWHHWQVGIC
jgi:hypothetical protein